MKYKKRALSEKLEMLLAHFPVVVVSGARQVGKTTLIRRLFPDWDLVTFDPVVDVGNARADPELFLRNHPSPLVLDEIQYSPALVPSIKRIVDEDKRPGMYLLTGSQQWSVLRSISESLAGRAVFLDLEGFSLAEIAEEWRQPDWLQAYLEDPDGFVHSRPQRLHLSRTLYETLWRGFQPEADTLPASLLADFYSAYFRTYIERDVRLILEAGDWNQFGAFVQLITALTAQEVNHSQLGREVGITPQTAKRWLSVLQATFQWHEVPAWSGNLIKRISSKPKGYLSDTGLACALQRISSPQTLAGHPITGALFETAVVGEIRKRMAPLSSRPHLHHWRLHSGSEVDLLLERDACLYPIEIKLTSRPKPKDARGIRAFREAYPKHRIAPGLVIAPIESMEQLCPGVFAIPWDLR